MTEENTSSLGRDGQTIGGNVETNPAPSTTRQPETAEPPAELDSPSRSLSPEPPPPDDDRTELHKFIQDIDSGVKDSKGLREILDRLEEDQIYQCSPNNDDRNALHMAVERGMLWAVEQLLDYKRVAKSILSEGDGEGRQPLHIACLNGHMDIAALLLERGAKIEATQSFGATPLDEASWKGHKVVVEFLLSRDANTQVVDSNGWSPIRSAAEWGREEVVQVLLDSNPANINDGDADGETPLYAASREGYEKVVDILLKKHAAIDKNDDAGRTPLYGASRNGNKEVVDLILKGNADIDKADNEGRTPLYRASQAGHEAVVGLLLEKAKVDEADNEGRTPLHAASQAGYEAVVDLLLKKAKVDLTDHRGRTPVMLASQNGHAACVQRLVEAHANCNLQTKKEESSKTALHYALESSAGGKLGQHDVVVELLKGNADPGIRNKKGETALHLAARSNDFCTYEKIQERMEDAEKKLQNEEGDTALSLVLKTHPHDILKLMTEESAHKFDAADEMEALLWAAQEEANHHHAVSLFKKRQGLMNTPPENPDSLSAIQWAAYLEMPSVLWLLLATSRSLETQEARRSELTKAEKLLNKAKRLPREKKDLGGAKADKSAKRETEDHSNGKREEEEAAESDQKGGSSPRRDKDLVLAILRNPPPVITSREKEKLEKPTIDEEEAEFLRKLAPKAAVIDYSHSAKDDKSALFTQFRRVHEVIYGTGPLKITKERAMTLEKLKRMNDSPAFQEACKMQEDRLGKSLFTWVHLPATNIPYITLSQQLEEQDVDKNDKDGGGRQQEQEAKGREGNDQEVDKKKTQLQEASKAYRDLLKHYQDNDTVIHGSATLDESFYHFSGKKETPEQEAQEEDRRQRNRSQVVTKSKYPEGVSGKPYWPLVRVNQLWVWIIGGKWLITATTHSVDQLEDHFLNDVLEYIAKQATKEGREVGSPSPLEMAKTIVNYCVDSYDRKPAEEIYGIDYSIRQIFSNSINKIVRQDTELFRDFLGRIGAEPSREDDQTGVEGSGAPKEKEVAPKKGGKGNTTENIEKAIRDAAWLAAEIRDIRDELQMLQAVANHQMRIQKKLEKESSADNGLWESYVMSDIGDMIKSADRIKSNVEMMLSLEQSQTANNQAKESVRQGEVAGRQTTETIQQGKLANKQAELANKQAEESVQQGKLLMIFTAITAFFVGVLSRHLQRIWN
ncbi:hypothetical protein N0V84_009550 [Fusarium piperis]|uniref:Ankyrin repeat protein n=1 Tax=Fusarium piperis TaxID=1435070 RepID=A0A9W8W639_9HYPO|nr:hypothetical protein N0V84_009550 [Fusarium piperis]